MRKIGKIIGKILSILSFVFVIIAVCKLGLDFTAIDNIPIFALVITISSLLLSCSVYLLGYAWKMWISFFSKHEVNSIEAVCVYAKANIGKYLPGNVMHYVERNVFAAKYGLNQQAVLTSSVFEVVSMVIAAILLAVCFAYDNLKRIVEQYIGDSIGVIIISGCIILTVVIIAIFILKKKVKDVLEQYSLISFMKCFMKCFLLYIVALFMAGVIMVVLYWYMEKDALALQVVYIISSYIISWVVGFIVPGAPGGIGVREMILLVLLADIAEKDIILTMIVIHRLITIIGDIIAYILALVVNNHKMKFGTNKIRDCK